MLLQRLHCQVTTVEDGAQCVEQFRPLLEYLQSINRGASGSSSDGQLATLASLSRDKQAELCKFDIVLMDNSMPVMDGVTATRLLRAGGVDPVACPIVGVTGNALEEDLAVFRAAGANEILTKPARIATLQNAIARYCPPFGTTPSPASTAGSHHQQQQHSASVIQPRVSGSSLSATVSTAGNAAVDAGTTANPAVASVRSVSSGSSSSEATFAFASPMSPFEYTTPSANAASSHADSAAAAASKSPPATLVLHMHDKADGKHDHAPA